MTIGKERIQHLLVKKALVKMAIADLPVGEEIPEAEDFVYQRKFYDYTHLLPLHLKEEGYRVVLEHQSAGKYAMDHALKVKLYHGREAGGKDKHIGTLEGSADLRGSSVTPELSHIKYKEHRGKGLGQALYTALFVHAKNKMGIGYVEGHEHSTMANRVHSKLSQIHGMKYKAKPNPRKLPGDEELDDAFGPYKYALKSEEDLNKGMLTGALAGLALAASPIQQVPQAIEAASPKVHAKESKWTPAGLHDELHPIAHLESNFGLKTEHAPNSLGSYHTAHGAVGLKVVTAHEEWKRNKDMKARFPGLEEPAHFEASFKTNHAMYNALASKHWKRIRKLTGSAEKAAYAWRFGLTACLRAKDEDIKNANYVKKFNSLLAQKQNVVVKSEKKLTEPLSVEHYSPVKGIETLDPAFQGSSKVKGVETARENRVPRVYAYVAGGEVEDSVAKEAQHKYSGVLPPETRLYDYGEDGEHLMDLQWSPSGHYDVPHLDDVEHELKSRGYHGYLNYNFKYPHAMALFYPLKVSYSGPYSQSLTKFEAEPLVKALDVTDDQIREKVSEATFYVSGATSASLDLDLEQASPEQLKVYAQSVLDNPRFWGAIAPTLNRAQEMWELEKIHDTFGFLSSWATPEDIENAIQKHVPVLKEAIAKESGLVANPAIDAYRDTQARHNIVKSLLRLPEEKLSPSLRDLIGKAAVEEVNDKKFTFLTLCRESPLFAVATEGVIKEAGSPEKAKELIDAKWRAVHPSSPYWTAGRSLLHFGTLVRANNSSPEFTAWLMSRATPANMSTEELQMLADKAESVWAKEPYGVTFLLENAPESVHFREPFLLEVAKSNVSARDSIAQRPELTESGANKIVDFFLNEGQYDMSYESGPALLNKISPDRVAALAEKYPDSNDLKHQLFHAALHSRKKHLVPYADAALDRYVQADPKENEYGDDAVDEQMKKELGEWAAYRAEARGVEKTKAAYAAQLTQLLTYRAISPAHAVEAINETNNWLAYELAREPGLVGGDHDAADAFAKGLKHPLSVQRFTKKASELGVLDTVAPTLEKREDFESIVRHAIGKDQYMSDTGDDFIFHLSREISSDGISRIIPILKEAISTRPRAEELYSPESRKVSGVLRQLAIKSRNFSAKHIKELASLGLQNHLVEAYVNLDPEERPPHLDNAVALWPHVTNKGQKESLQVVLSHLSPEFVNTERTSFSIGTSKARKVRDLIVQQTQAKNPSLNPDDMKGREVQPKSLPPWTNTLAVGRMPNGNISAEKMQSWIDSQSKYEYGVSHSVWNGLQRHNDEPSQVFQLNMTKAHLDEIRKDPELLKTFENFRKKFYQRGHPANPWTLGWVRWTKTDSDNERNRPDFFIDEIQSDLGINFIKDPFGELRSEVEGNLRHFLKTGEGSFFEVDDGRDRELLTKYHEAPNEAAKEDIVSAAIDQHPELVENRRLFEQLCPKEHLKKLHKILFDGKHPSILLFEGFNQWLRDQGHTGGRIFIHGAVGKAVRSGLSLSDTKAQRLKDGKGGVKVQYVQALPGHTLVTYDQIPKDAGWTPSVYAREISRGQGSSADGTSPKRLINYKIDKDTGATEPFEQDAPTHQDEIRKSEELAQFYADSEGVILG